MAGRAFKASLLFLLALYSAGVSAAPQIETFSPQGIVKGVRQVAVRFSEAMVPFGDPRLVEPFDIDCPEQGTARWADSRNWVYDFARDLPAGIQCTFTLRPAAHTLKGRALTGTTRFSFSTGGPAVKQSLPYEGDLIDEEQIFLLGLDAPAKPESIERHVFCDIDGVAEKVGVKLLTGETRRTILEQRQDFLERYYRVLFKTSRGGAGMAAIGTREPGSDWDRFLKLKDADVSPLVVLQCRRRFPNDAEVRLIWGEGVASPGGVATTEAQKLVFKSREAFKARFTCDRVNKDADCIPALPLYLDFTAPIARAQAQKIVLNGRDGKVYAPTLDGDAKDEFVTGVHFMDALPEKSVFTLALPEGLVDDAGRRLANENSFPLLVKTDESPPLAKFSAAFGIIELNADATLPVTLRNLEPELPYPRPGGGPAANTATPLETTGWLAMLKERYRQLREQYWPESARVNGVSLRIEDPGRFVSWMKRVRESQESEGQYDEEKNRFIYSKRPGDRSIFNAGDPVNKFTVPRSTGARDFEVVGIPFHKPGFYIVEIASPRLGQVLHGKPEPYYVQTAILVTNLAVHFEHGRESSLVWVTTLDNAKAVGAAAISVGDCDGKIYWRGTADADGIARIEETLPDLPTGCEGYVVTAGHDDDMSFALSNWGGGISPWRFNLPVGNRTSADIAATVFDRTLFRAGETVHMKHFARHHTRTGFADIDPKSLGGKLTIRHQGSDQQYSVDLAWNADATADSVWEIPKDAKQGTYVLSFDVDAGSGSERRIEAGSFRVESYRIPLMRALLQPVKPDLVNATETQLDIQVNYLAGGGAGGLPVKLRGLVEPKTVSFPDYEDFAFANGNVREGPQEADPYAWRFSGYDMEEPGEDADGAARNKPLATQSLTLDAAGAVRATMADLPKADTPQSVLAEVEYADPNGELLTGSRRMNLWPAGVLVGLKPDSWALSKDHLKFQAIAVDLQGKPIAGRKIEIDLLQRITTSHRKRLIGGFYAYENREEIKRIGDLCRGETDVHGRLYCEVKAPADGNLILRARTTDAAGNQSYAHRDIWVAGRDDWWYEVGNEDRMDLIPEQKRYEPGDTAVFQVRMPFREATALVTVEREGVMESFVQPLSGKSPVVKVPLKGSYAPNVYVSVLAVRGRVNDAQPTALVDLGRPAYKLGLAEIKVGWRAHELKVDVKTDRDAYKVREQVHASIKVRRADGQPLPEGAEVALAVVDEGLLELMPNTSWDLLDAMMGRRGIEVATATAQMQVIGKRHYGKKAVPHGGGGGISRQARELFDPLLYWQARVKLDASGAAEADFPVNDSLTAFKVVAVADAGSGLFGTGTTSFRSTQDVMLFSGLPPLVREQDQFHAGFTVRNASGNAFSLTLNAAVDQQSGAERPQALDPPLPPITLTLQAGEARDIGWEVTAPLDAQRLQWELSAQTDTGSGDHIKTSQKVIQTVPVRTFQATLLQLDKLQSVPIRIPADALPGRGGIHVHLQNMLAGSLSGVREYMSFYPYTCLEQRVSQAVALRDQALWRGVMAALPSYLDSDGLAKYFPFLYHGEDALTAYLLAIANEAGWEIPDDLRLRMQKGLVNFVQGRVMRDSALPTADLSIRKLAAISAVARYETIDPSWLDSIDIMPNLWPTSAVIDWLDLLRRDEALPNRKSRLEEAKQIIRSRLNYQGTTMGFSTERSDYLWWLMISADVNANRALLSLLGDADWHEDLPRMLRGTLGRQVHGHWNTTVANAWGVLAAEKFAHQFEQAPVTGVTHSVLSGGVQELDWGTLSSDESGRMQGDLTHPWPPAPVVVATLDLAHDGTGAPWATVQSLAAIPLKAPLSSGYHIKRTVTPIEQKQPGVYSRGDVLRVRLELTSQTDMTWVVVNDPIPAGASILGTGLGKDSQILTQGEQRQGFVWPAFEERAFDAFHAYYQFVPKGNWVVEYTLRLNNPGHFTMPATRVEAMYSPEMFGAIPNTPVEVRP
ncbi:MAG TPA: MG2 domain-containing protein [Gammaproteobacteria bacterium]|nr:MG2 domain-containing protein [Gammaproteobacteria bacterium]